ncbi:MAG: putative toxin-antitoxin system toxin component, PIN family [Candidatus Dormibacteraeota bacterium]|nr:putative toxin-antitoxin system toxin component, PIN family [Candidatus Dormibacteraeota bacterium]
MRAVLDVNVLAAALMSRTGAPGRLIALWLEGAFELVISEALLLELGRAFAYPQLRKHISSKDGADFIGLLRATASLRADRVQPPQVSRDPGDDYLVALATSSASILVTGDRDLLTLAPQLPVHSPAEFLKLLQT